VLPLGSLALDHTDSRPLAAGPCGRLTP
jgi:hypothetical protein